MGIMAGARITQWLWTTAKNVCKTVDAKLRTNPVRQCPYCGKDVVSLGYQVKQYCNNICYQRYQRAKTKKIRQQRICLECDAVFTPKRDNHFRCSSHCRKVFQARYFKEHRLKYKKKERSPCKFCGQLFEPSHYLIIFCGPRCKREHEATIKVKPKLLFQPDYRDITEKDLNTSKHSDAIQEFKESGGQVKVYPSLPGPKIQNTGASKGAEWSIKSNIDDLDEYDDVFK